MTPKQWHEWLITERDAAFQVYKIKPRQLIADARHEKQLTGDYEGREFLELLQNCTDAAYEAKVPGRVRIELAADGLVVANTGAPFSKGGVESLLTSDVSPKPGGRSGTIGSKGLGFRALLNWSSRPIILSGGLRVAFAPEIAARFMGALREQDARVNEAVAKEDKSGRGSPCPLLPFPDTTSNGDLRQIVAKDCRDLLKRCELLLDQGYITAIALPFNKAAHFEAARAQIGELTPEFLLFSDMLEEIAIVDEGTTTWRCERPSKRKRHLVIGGAEEHRSEWDLFAKEGTVPARILRETTDPERYQLCVAVPQQGYVPAAKTLFCYFPTDVTLPIGALCHATVELDQSRNRLQKIEANDFVLAALADHIADIAAKLAAESQSSRWRGLDLLRLRDPFPAELSGFKEQLFKAAATRPLLPLRDGKLATAANARRFSQAEALPVEQFPDVLAPRDWQDNTVLGYLGVAELSSAEFIQRIADSEFTLDTRARIVVGLIKAHASAEFCAPSLLVDTQGRPPQESDLLFLPPEGAMLDLKAPPWSQIKILSGPLLELVAAGLGETNVRALRRRLEGFDVNEYSLANIISRLSAAANRQIEAKPTSEGKVRQELLSALAQIFASTDAARRPSFPAAASIKVQSQARVWEATETLYLGRPYGDQGEVVQALYKGTPQKLVGAPGALGLPLAVDEAQEFLSWIGVARWPRTHVVNTAPREFLKHVLSNIEYPAPFEGDQDYPDSEAIPYPSLDQVTSLDDFESLLKAPSAAILAWLANDARFDGWRLPGSHARLGCRPYRAQYDRHYRRSVPSYIDWKIRTTAWLPNTTGKPMPPSECMFGDKSIEELFPRPLRPAAEDAERFGLTGSGISIALVRAGVASSIGGLDTGDLYRHLLALPNKSRDGRAAKRFYAWMLEAHSAEIDEADVDRGTFLRRGQMWGRFGQEEGYYAIESLHHVEQEGLPATVLSHLKVVDLPKRRGAEKIARLFGIRTFDRASLRQSVTYHESAPVAAAAALRFEEAKPFFIALRSFQTEKSSQREQLRRIRLEVASKATATATMAPAGDVTYQLPLWTSVITDSTRKRTLYVDRSKLEFSGLGIVA